jgi:hypothetical protein
MTAGQSEPAVSAPEMLKVKPAAIAEGDDVRNHLEITEE